MSAFLRVLRYNGEISCLDTDKHTAPTSENILEHGGARHLLVKIFHIEVEEIEKLHPETRARICLLLEEWKDMYAQAGTAHICWVTEQLDRNYEKLHEIFLCNGLLTVEEDM